MKLIKIINARNTLESFSDREDIQGHLSYWMTKFVVKTKSEYDFYSTEIRKIISKYGNKDDEGNIVVPNEKFAECNEEISKLDQTDVEDPNIKFFLSELSQLKLSMKQMHTLLDFIDEEK